MRGDMRGKQRAEVHIAGRVAAYDEEVLIPEEIRTVFYAAGRAEGLMLDAVLHMHAEARPVAEVALYILRAVFKRRADIREAVLFQQAHYMLQHGPPEKRHHGLRRVSGHGFQARALSARHYDSFHCDHSRLLLKYYPREDINYLL